MADDWLEDDLGEMQPKKKRRLVVDQSGMRGEDGASTSRGQNSLLNSDSAYRSNDLTYLSYFISIHIYLLSVPSL